jgi:two-component system NtrC family sensor kinase
MSAAPQLSKSRDLPLRTKLLICFLAVTVVGGVLTIVAGSFVITDMVIGEAQRRVEVGLKTARSTLQQRADEAERTASILADWAARQPDLYANGVASEYLEKLRGKCGLDLLHIVDADGTVTATARGNARGLNILGDAVVGAAIREGRASWAFTTMSARQLSAESAELASQAYVKVVETERAKPGGLDQLREALVIQAAAPIIRPPGRVVGAVRAAVLLTRNYELVDYIRDNVFTMSTYDHKNLGTVTIFLRDVRIATNVIGPTGERAIGTRVSAEVNDRVLGRGETWVGPAYVVGNWYVSAYEPIRDTRNSVIGILYVGVLKDRYDDMRSGAMGFFLLCAAIAVIAAFVVGTWLAGRLARPLDELTGAAVQIARGNLEHRLPEPARADRDELKKLTVAFNAMAASLQQRDEELRRSHQDLAETADELKRWNQNYLDTLEFITHELKNQVAAMKINLLAVRDGYVGELEPDQREALDDVVVAVNRTEEMILNYLNLSRLEKGDLEVRVRPVQVEVDVVRPVLRELKARFDEKQMQLEVALPEDMIVQADPSLLQIVYENLLSNAAKYGRENGLVRVWGERVNGWAELHVWNEGQGVAPDQADELFRKFSRLQPPGEQERGTGLGLFITREIVRKHGGDIRAESEAGQWIDFVFRLPRPDVVLGEEEQLDETIG